MKFFFWVKLIYKAKWGNKRSATLTGAYWITTDYMPMKEMPKFFDHKHEKYNLSANPYKTHMECVKCGIFGGVK